jgi:hypothetical protein
MRISRGLQMGRGDCGAVDSGKGGGDSANVCAGCGRRLNTDSQMARIKADEWPRPSWVIFM